MPDARYQMPDGRYKLQNGLDIKLLTTNSCLCFQCQCVCPHTHSRGLTRYAFDYLLVEHYWVDCEDTIDGRKAGYKMPDTRCRMQDARFKRILCLIMRRSCCQLKTKVHVSSFAYCLLPIAYCLLPIETTHR